jgi:hypothetical protein
MKQAISVEFKGLGDTMIFASANVWLTYDVGTEGSLLDPSVEFAGLYDFDYTLENENGDQLEAGEACDEKSHPNTHSLIENYLVSNWDTMSVEIETEDI